MPAFGNGPAIEEPPSRKSAVMIEMPTAAAEETVAVKVTGWPYTLGLADEVTAVVVLAGLTICDALNDAKLLSKLPSPLYVAEIV